MGVMGQPPDARSDMNEKNGRTYVIDTTVYFAAITAVAAFILSMPPLIKVGGVELPTPSIIMRSLAPVLRFYSRWGLVVTFALTLLAGVGFALLATSRNWNFRKTGVICALLVALFCVDVTIIPPWRSRDISRPPDVVRALSRLPRDEPVAMYPLKPGIYSVPLWYLYYQQYHRHPMINGVKAATEADLYLMVMNDIYAPYTPRMLKGLGIKEVVILNDFYKLMFPSGDFFNPDKMPPGYKLVKKTDDGYIFDVTAAPAQVFPLFYLNFTPPRLQPDGMAWSAMVRPEGKILLVNKGGRSTFDFSVTVYNPGKEDALDVELDSGAHGRFQVPRGPSQLTVPRVELTKQRHFLTFEWSGEPVKIEGEASGVDGQLDAYLLFSRPELNRVPPGR